jgi:polysaccharide export outer membrane protein
MKTGGLPLKLSVLTLALLALAAVPFSAGQKAPAGDSISAPQTGSNDGTAQSATGDASTALHKRNWRYRINPSDTLELTFAQAPEFNQTVTVQPDGYITLRLVGDLPAGGQTLPELTASIKTAYSKIMQDPEVTVDPKEFEKPFFTVGGQVGKPGKFDWYADITLTQAIAIAGGFTDASKHSQVLLFRRVSDEWSEAKIINVKKMVSARDLREDPELKPGDMLFVPKNALSKIKPFLPTSSVGLYGAPLGF